ncbi:MAG: PH domain-containing protein [Candidatus Anstonellaceae archaeon]
MAEVIAKPNLKVHFLFSFFNILLIMLLLISISFILVYLSIIDFQILVFFSILFLISLIAAFSYSYLYYTNTSLIIKNEKLIYETGILHHHINTVPLKSVTDYSLKRGFIQRFFKVGTLSINTAGGFGFEIIAENFDYDKLLEIKHVLDSSRFHK